MNNNNLTTAKPNETKKGNSFSYSFQTSQSPDNVFKTLLDVRSWWVGLFGETIKGYSKQLNDEFTFAAGNGAHFTRQKLIGLEPDKSITWLVTESNLNFAKKTDEWTDTKIRFDISKESGKTNVLFTHEGLVPKFECYDGCAGAWTQYLENLKMHLN
jgi:hypothetical protein